MNSASKVSLATATDLFLQTYDAVEVYKVLSGHVDEGRVFCSRDVGEEGARGEVKNEADLQVTLSQVLVVYRNTPQSSSVRSWSLLLHSFYIYWCNFHKLSSWCSPASRIR